jgi:hypothetical protein
LFPIHYLHSASPLYFDMMDGSVIIQIAEDREKILNDLNSIMPAAFISFKTRWGAAFCAQTQQSRNQLCG